MRRLLSLISCLFVLPIILLAQKTDSRSALLSMVETERAFARMSEEKGTRPSFMAFIAEDGILFRPKAVKGKQYMAEHPLPPSDKRDLLSWTPSFADVARAGDMGYTFGPWQYKSDIREDRPVAWGHFVTIWQKQADGSWKFAVDLGISHPEPIHTGVLLTQPQSQPPGKQRKSDTERAALLTAERKFSEDSAGSGAQKAFLSHAATNVNVFREGKLPFTGKALAAEAIPSGAGLWTWQPEAWDVSRSGDLGYSYGTYWLKGNGSAGMETGNYFRIWKKQGGAWKVVVDLANPVPEKKN
ncbi:MAG: nuclear transport factor 2 family protein [Acidobacteriota bacterium]